VSHLSSSTNPTRSKQGGPYRKPRADLYTMLLLISLVALILGIVCLYAEMESYKWEFKGGPTVTSMAAPLEPGLAAKQLLKPHQQNREQGCSSVYGPLSAAI